MALAKAVANAGDRVGEVAPAVDVINPAAGLVTKAVPRITETASKIIIQNSEKPVNVVTRDGLLVLTNRRVIFYMFNMFGGYEFQAYAIRQISSMQFTSGIPKGRIDITVAGKDMVVKNVENGEGQIATNLIQAAIDKLGRQTDSPTATESRSFVKRLFSRKT